MVRWSFAKVKLQCDQNCDLTKAKSWQMGQYSFKRCCYIVYDHKVNLMQPSRKEFINGVGLNEWGVGWGGLSSARRAQAPRGVWGHAPLYSAFWAV